MGWMMLWWPIGLLLIVLLIWAFIVRGGPLGPRGPSESPEQIVKRRYAKGEIDRETYERMLGDLKT